mmetsp:Transcript_28340/g.77556  ORF Transcript_28340/g.77556 Transcript_28340/m.77556 type:complete len:242 (-) Transcript_28340:307-1032(-)|eukprot:scaffold49851_cov36-Tisochrysis_lutea.AAC.1
MRPPPMVLRQLRAAAQEKAPATNGGRRALIQQLPIFLAAALSAPAQQVLARPEGVNKPELLPPGPVTNVIDLKKYLTSGERTKMDAQLTKLEKDTGYKVRVLCQQYPDTPGLAIKDYWGLDDNSIILIADKGTKGTSNMLNFNVADGVKLQLPNTFWSRLQSAFGNTFFIKENGEDISIRRAIDTIDYCLREEYGCADVPLQFKDPSRAMYGDPTDPFKGSNPFSSITNGISSGAEKIFGS